MTSTRRIDGWWPAALLVSMALIVFAPVLFGSRTLYPTDITNNLILPFAANRTAIDVQATSISDYVLYYFPVRYFQAASFRSGQLNLWNPYIFGGQPAFANNASIVAFDPFNLLLLSPNLGAALAWRSFLQVVACLLFMYAYLRHLQLSVAGALIGAIGYGFNSMFWVNIFDWSISGMLWLPLVCLLLDRCVAKPSARQVALTGLVLGLALLSSPLQIYGYECFTIAGILALQWFVAGRDLATLKRAALVAGAVFAIGIALTAVQIIPSLELYSHSTRLAGRPLQASGKAARSLRQTVMASVALATFVFPNLAGRLKESMMVSGVLWGGEAHWQGFIGIAPFFLAVVAAGAGTARRRIPYVILGLAVPIVVLYTPLGQLLYERFFLVYIFCACVLAAFGCTALCQGEVVSSRAQTAVLAMTWFVGAVIVVLLCVNLALAVAGARAVARLDQAVLATLSTNYFGQSYPALYLQKAHHLLDDLSWHSPQTFVPLLIGCLALATINLRMHGRLRPQAFATVAVALTAGDLLFMTVTHVPYVDVRRNPFTPSSPAIDRLRDDAGLSRVISYRSPAGPPVLPLGLTSTYGLTAADGNDDLGPPNVFRLISFRHERCGDELCVRPENTDLAAVRYVLADPNVRLPEDRFDLVYASEIRVFRDRRPFERAFWMTSYEVIQDVDAAIARVRSSTFDPRAAVILDAAPLFPSTDLRDGARVSVLQHTALKVVVKADVTTPGLLVLSDTYYPGWQADIDRQPTHIFRANGVMRAVALPVGTHTVTYRYDPSSLRLGAAISASSFVAALSMALAMRKSQDGALRA
jgi:hypothetical protein